MNAILEKLINLITLATSSANGFLKTYLVLATLFDKFQIFLSLFKSFKFKKNMKSQTIDDLHGVITAATDIAEEVDQILADDKVSLLEVLTGLMSNVGNAQTILQKGKPAVLAYVNGSNEYREEALNFLAEELQLSNEEVDEKLDKTIAALGKIESNARNIIENIKEISVIWN